MGNLLDCIKGAGTREGGTLQDKARSRSARRHLSSFPQWIPPSPSFPLPSPLAHGSQTQGRDLTVTVRQQSPKDIGQKPHPSHHMSPLVVGQSFKDSHNRSMPCPSHPSRGHPTNPLAAGPGPISNRSNPMPHDPAQPNNFASASSNLLPRPSFDIAVTGNPLMGPRSDYGRDTREVLSGDKGEHNSIPFRSRAENFNEDLFQSVSTSEDWSLFSEEELEFQKPKAARKLLFNDDPPSENSFPPSRPNLNGKGGSNSHGCGVDVNFANVHELCVAGFTEEQARNVVAYRVKQQQHFQSKTELKAVPGIDEETWQRVKSRITLVPRSVRSTKGLSRSRVRSTGTRIDASSKESPSSSVHHTDASQDCKQEGSKVMQSSSAGKISIDVNSCNEPELCAVGLSQSQAAAVVKYRVMVGGAFKSVEDLRLVPGISEEAYMDVRTKLTLANSQRCRHLSGGTRKQQGGVSVHASVMNPLSGISVFQAPNTIPPGGSNYSRDTITPASRITGSNLSHKGPNSASGGFSSDKSPNNIHSVASIQPRGALPFSQPHPPRTNSGHGGNSPCSRFQIPAKSPVAGSWLPGNSPKASPRSVGGKTGGVPLRIASWNLQVFKNEKVSRPGVLEVVCSTIVQHGFDIIAVQEVGSKSSLEKVCQELNNPSLPKVLSLGGNERRWDYCVSDNFTGRMFQGMEYSGFLWNRCSGVTLDSCQVIKTDLFVRKPFIGTFMLNRVKFIVISVHLKAENWGGKDKQRVENEVYDLPFLLQSIDQGGIDVVLLGDFNLPPSSACFQPLHTSGYSNILNDGDCTNISSANPAGSKCYDNIWVSSHPRWLHYNERHGVVRRNLAVPPARAGEKSQTVSDHCPIWARFLCTQP